MKGKAGLEGLTPSLGLVRDRDRGLLLGKVGVITRQRDIIDQRVMLQRQDIFGGWALRDLRPEAVGANIRGTAPIRLLCGSLAS